MTEQEKQEVRNIVITVLTDLGATMTDNEEVPYIDFEASEAATVAETLTMPMLSGEKPMEEYCKMTLSTLAKFVLGTFTDGIPHTIIDDIKKL